MNRNLFLLVLAFVSCQGLRAQTDLLGPHNVNGSGCALCHLPGRTSLELSSAESQGNFWEETSSTPDVASASGTLTEDQPLFHTFICLTCHDGSIATTGKIGRDTAAVKGRKFIFEPVIARSDSEHPVHVPYLPNGGCGDPSSTCNPDHWPSYVDRRGVITWSGSKFTEQAAAIYGRPSRFFPSSENGGQAMVECSTCHNPHSSEAVHYNVNGKIEWKPSKAFLRGWYETEGKYSDTVSKFCRSCHYAQAPDSVNLRQ